MGESVKFSEPRERLKPLVIGGRIIGHGQQLARRRLADMISKRGPIAKSAPRFVPRYERQKAGELRRVNLKPHEAR